MENSRFKCTHQHPKHAIFHLASCPSASNPTLRWANWKMFCLLPAQSAQASPCFSCEFFAHGCPAKLCEQWVAAEIPTQILSPKHRDQEGPKGWICGQKAE